MKIRLLWLATLMGLNAVAFAVPQGADVQAGDVNIQTPNANETIIHQASDKAIINWQSFNIAQGEKVQFIVPNSGSATLNRVVGNDPSQIFGSLISNGVLYLINPNGIVFGANSQVNTASLVASTLNIRNEDFLAGRNHFEAVNGLSPAAIVNLGTLTAGDKGVIALLAPQINNQGVIHANLGQVVMAAGTKATLNFADNRLLGFTVEGTPQLYDENGQPVTAINQSGRINADGGQVFLSAQAVHDVLSKAINMDGIIQANTVNESKGEIVLSADKGNISVSGTMSAAATQGDGGSISVRGENIALAPSTNLDVSGENGGDIIIFAQNHTDASGTLKAVGTNGQGGFIETSGKQTLNFSDLAVDTNGTLGDGTWLLDPEDITLSAQQINLIVQALANNNIIIQTNNGLSGNGDITLAGNLSWSSNNYLQLSAYRNIVFNSGYSITNTGAGGLVLRADNGSTGTGTVIFNGSSPQIIMGSSGITQIFYNPTGGYAGSDQSLVGTDRYRNNVSGGTLNSYMLVNSVSNLQSLGTSGSIPLNGKYALGQNLNLSSVSNFTPIGSQDATNGFQGYFNGNFYTISNMTITSGSTQGLFSRLTGNSQVSNLNLTGVNITGVNFLGALAGRSSNTTIENVFVSGTISGTSILGGLIGQVDPGTTTVNQVESNVNVAASGAVTGGIIGRGLAGSTVNVSNTVVNATLSASSNVGGIVGTGAASGTISNSMTSGSYTSQEDVGGIVGEQSVANTLSNNFSNATLSKTSGTAGGVGGLIGRLSANSQIQNSFYNGTFGSITNGSIGGIVGVNTSLAPQFSGTYWLSSSGASNGVGSNTGGGGLNPTGTSSLTAAQFASQSSFPSYAFGTIWAMGSTAPTLPNAGTYGDRTYVNLSLAAINNSSEPAVNPAVEMENIEQTFGGNPSLGPNPTPPETLQDLNNCIDFTANKDNLQINRRNPCYEKGGAS